MPSIVIFETVNGDVIRVTAEGLEHNNSLIIPSAELAEFVAFLGLEAKVVPPAEV